MWDVGSALPILLMRRLRRSLDSCIETQRSAIVNLGSHRDAVIEHTVDESQTTLPILNDSVTD